MTTQRFRAVVGRAGARTAVVLPFDPDAVWGAKQRHHITGSVDGAPVRGPLGSHGGQPILPLGAAWLRDNGVTEGAEVEVELAPEGPQLDGLAPDLAAALEGEPDARAFFESLATFYRTGYLRWLAGARRPEQRQARIAELIGLLKAGKKQR